MKSLNLLACVCLLATVSGCFPKESIFWSPDGSRALILTEDSSYLCDPNGKLTELDTSGLWGKPKSVEVTGVAVWFPDSRRVALLTTAKLRKWKDIEPLLSVKRRDDLIALAQTERTEILTGKSTIPWEIEKGVTVPQDRILARIYLRDCRPEGLAQKLGKTWKVLDDAGVPGFAIQIADVAEQKRQPGPVLVKSIRSIANLRLNHQATALAYVAEAEEADHDSDKHPIFLCVIPVNGKESPRVVADGTGIFFDWTGDGTSLAYVASKSVMNEGNFPAGMGLGAIALRQVCNDNGLLLKDFPASKEMVAILYHPCTPCYCLKDERILFGAAEVTLPATTGDMPDSMSLFSIDPTRQATVTCVLTRLAKKKLSQDGLAFSRLSPDQTRISIPDNDNKVAVVTVANSDVTSIDIDSHMIPVWRAGGELCVLVPAGSPLGSPKRAEVVLWTSPEKWRCISKNWPDSLIDALSQKQKESPKPTTTSASSQKS